MEKSDQLTIVISVKNEDLERFRILLQSLSFFMKSNGILELLVISEDHLFREYTPQKGSDKTWDMDFPPPPIKARNFTFNQINKGPRRGSKLPILHISNFISTPFYLFLPVDSFSTKPWGLDDLIRSDRAMIQLDLIEIPDILKMSQLLGMDPLLVGDRIISKGPAVLSTDISRKLIKNIHMVNADISFCRDIDCLLYYLYAVKIKQLNSKHFVGTLSHNNIWNPTQIFTWMPKGGYFCVYSNELHIPADIIYDQIRDHIGDPRPQDTPRISCLMVTKNRLKHVRTSIKHFQKQTYPNKELIIVCDSPDGVKEYVKSINDSNIHVYQLKSEKKTLGELRNKSVEFATGEYICQWDDDDWFHPSRLSIQYQKLNKRDVCFLSQCMLAWPDEQKFGVSHSREEGWGNTMMARKNILPKYLNVSKDEDKYLMKQLSRQTHVIQDPMYWILYGFLVHKNNISELGYFQSIFQQRTSFHEFWPQYAQQFSHKLSEDMNQNFLGYGEEDLGITPSDELIVGENTLAAIIFILLLASVSVR